MRLLHVSALFVAAIASVAASPVEDAAAAPDSMAAATSDTPAGFQRIDDQLYNRALSQSDPRTWWCEPDLQGTHIILNGGDADNGRDPGAIVQNAGSADGWYFVYENSRDWMPYKGYRIKAGETIFIKTCNTFQGRIVRGTRNANKKGAVCLLGTWAEFNFNSVPGYLQITGDVSVIRGCDGAVRMENTDGSNLVRGFTESIVGNAPSHLTAAKCSNQYALRPAADKGDVLDYYLSKIGHTGTYIVDTHRPRDNPVINSLNGRMKFTFYTGRH